MVPEGLRQLNDRLVEVHAMVSTEATLQRLRSAAQSPYIVGTHLYPFGAPTAFQHQPGANTKGPCIRGTRTYLVGPPTAVPTRCKLVEANTLVYTKVLQSCPR